MTDGPTAPDPARRGAAETGASRSGPGPVGVVVTRDEADDGPLTTLLTDRGFAVHHWPSIRFAPPEDPGPLTRALDALADFDWAVFTSPRAVAAVARASSDPGGPARASAGLPVRPAGLAVAAVGESTAAALTDAGWTADVVPEEATGGALVGALAAAGVGAGHRVFFPASALARDAVPDGLAGLGAEVTQVTAYRTVVPALDAAACRAELESGAVAVVTFTSPSTVQNLQEVLGPETFDLAVRRTRAVAIGPTTAAAVRAAGFDPVVEADPHSLEGLADAVAGLADRDSIQEAH